MTIVTKYSQGDCIWYMLGSKPVVGRINGIETRTRYLSLNPGNVETYIVYSANAKGLSSNQVIDEVDAFPTKEALLASL